MKKEIEVASEVTGSVWKILFQIGQSVQADEPIMLIESMKMEIPVVSEKAGVISAVMVSEGDAVNEGDVVVRITI